MQKRDILGNFVKKDGVLCEYEIKKLDGQSEAYSALITFLPGTRELRCNDCDKALCLGSEGYKWLMYLPIGEFWSLETFYNSAGELIQWYFDINKRNFIDESGMPCREDLYLDLVVLPDGQTMTLDADELQEALDISKISIDDYHHAYKIHDQIKASKWSNVTFLSQLSAKLLADYA